MNDNYTKTILNSIKQKFDKLGRWAVQSDWGQNDASAPDFIKNRAGGYEHIVSETETIAPQTVSTVDGRAHFYGNPGGTSLYFHDTDYAGDMPRLSELEQYTNLMAATGKTALDFGEPKQMDTTNLAVYDLGDGAYALATKTNFTDINSILNNAYVLVVNNSLTAAYSAGTMTLKKGIYTTARYVSSYYSHRITSVDIPVSKTEVVKIPEKYLEIPEQIIDHRKFTNRDATDAHPMSAITGLSDAIAKVKVFLISLMYVSDKTYTSDKTFAQILAAYNAGQQINVELSNYPNMQSPLTLALTMHNGTQFVFSGTITDSASNKAISAYADSSNAWDVEVTNLVDTNDKLANPNALTIKVGSAEVIYDGSDAQTVEITAGNSDSSGVFIIDTQGDAIKFKNTIYGDSVQAAIKAGRTVLIYQNNIGVFSPIAHIQTSTVIDSNRESYTVLKLLPLIYEDYQGSGTYIAAFQTAETYKTKEGLITLYTSKIDLYR